MEKITAPWSVEQVASLNNYQNIGWMHPFTCPNHADDAHNEHPYLRATPEGWQCDACPYTQDWAWQFMAERPPDMLGWLA